MPYVPAYANTDGRISADPGPSLSGAAGLLDSRVVSGAGSYVYEQFSDGSIKIVSGPTGAGTTLTAGSAWAAITAEIGSYVDDSGAEATIASVWSSVKDPSDAAMGIAAVVGILGLITAGTLVYRRMNRGY